jgi:hypothetical protein
MAAAHHAAAASQNRSSCQPLRPDRDNHLAHRCFNQTMPNNLLSRYTGTWRTIETARKVWVAA